MPQGLGSHGSHSLHVLWTSFWRCHSLSSSSPRPLSCALMETSPSPQSTTFVPSPPNTTSMVNDLLGERCFLVVDVCPKCSNTMWSLCATVWYEPTDADKACKPFLSDAWKSLTYSSPNLVELCTMTRTLGIPTPDGKFIPQWFCLILELNIL